MGPIELNVAFETAKGMVMAQAGRNYPAPVAAVTVMQDAAGMNRSDALQVEHKAFARLAVGEVAANLVQMFLNDQLLAGMAKKAAKLAKKEVSQLRCWGRALWEVASLTSPLPKAFRF